MQRVAARSTLGRGAQVIPGALVIEHDIAMDPVRAECIGIDTTPTVIVRDAAGREVVRATGVPTIDHVLAAAARALDSNAR